ncbi:MAG: hypothetical protein GIW97_07425, partial [Candidatus Eremiobacteraeota bacterium]|nr:hypothetical protein [Candidatus Eremiobacteraeota bacterium]
PKGKETKRDEVIGTMKQQLKHFHGTDCKNTIDSVSAPDASKAIVVNTQHVVGDIQAPDGKHDIDLVGKSSDTWKLVDGKWLQIKSVATHLVIKIDGSVVQDQGQ